VAETSVVLKVLLSQFVMMILHK